MQTGRVADSLKQQLAKMLTEAEFAPERAWKPAAAAATEDSPEDADTDADGSTAGVAGSSGINGQGDSGSAGQPQQHAQEDAALPDDLGTSIGNLLNSIRAVQKHASASDVDRPDAELQPAAKPLPEDRPPAQPAAHTQRRSAPMSVAEAEAEADAEAEAEAAAAAEAEAGSEQQPQPQPVRAAPDSPQQLHAGHPRRRAAGRSQRHASAKQRPAPAIDATHEAADAASTAAGQDKVYIDDETGEQFVLPDEVHFDADGMPSFHTSIFAKWRRITFLWHLYVWLIFRSNALHMAPQVLPEGEEKVYVDDRTGHTYVVTDDGRADPGSSGRVGRLSRRLSDNQQWLDGLSDQEYDEYMVSILDCLAAVSSA